MKPRGALTILKMAAGGQPAAVQKIAFSPNYAPTGVGGDSEPDPATLDWAGAFSGLAGRDGKPLQQGGYTVTPQGTGYRVYDGVNKKAGHNLYSNLVPDGQGGWKMNPWHEKKHDNLGKDMLKMGAALAAGYGGAALMSGLSGALGASAASSGAGFIGEGVASGIPAWDAAATSAGLDLGAGAGAAGSGAGATMDFGLPEGWNPGPGTQVADAARGGLEYLPEAPTDPHGFTGGFGDGLGAAPEVNPYGSGSGWGGDTLSAMNAANDTAAKTWMDKLLEYGGKGADVLGKLAKGDKEALGWLKMLNTGLGMYASLNPPRGPQVNTNPQSRFNNWNPAQQKSFDKFFGAPLKPFNFIPPNVAPRYAASGGAIHSNGCPCRMCKGGALRQYAQGGLFVEGQDGGQDDTVEAMLSPGEYVFDADVVSALGDGNNAAGAAKLDEMRERIREHKRGAPFDEIPPKARGALSYLRG